MAAFTPFFSSAPTVIPLQGTIGTVWALGYHDANKTLVHAAHLYCTGDLPNTTGAANDTVTKMACALPIGTNQVMTARFSSTNAAVGGNVVTMDSVKVMDRDGQLTAAALSPGTVVTTGATSAATAPGALVAMLGCTNVQFDTGDYYQMVSNSNTMATASAGTCAKCDIGLAVSNRWGINTTTLELVSAAV